MPAPFEPGCGTWDEQDLLRRLCHALDIAGLAVEHLAAHGYSAPGDPSKNISPEKIVAETAILLVAASPAMIYPEVDARIRNVAELLIPHARSDRARVGLCLEPALAWEYALAHICLNRIDYPDYEFDQLLSVSLESQARNGREREPHRMLEQEWVATAWYQPKPGRRQTSPPAARRSILAEPIDLLSCSHDDIYAFTRAIMYVTDFNLIPALLPRRRALILAEAEALLAYCLDEQDYALSGEILLSWPLTGKLWSSAAGFGFRVLAHVEDKAGFLPTASAVMSQIKGRDGMERRQCLLASTYHTAYVMGLLCAACLKPGYAPPAAVTAAESRAGRSALILKLLDADGKHPHWRDEFRQIPALEADALAGFLLNITLRRRVALRDFSGLRGVLALAHDLDLAATPSAIQAAELLDRLAVYAKITSDSELEPVSSALGAGVA